MLFVYENPRVSERPLESLKGTSWCRDTSLPLHWSPFHKVVYVLLI